MQKSNFELLIEEMRKDREEMRKDREDMRKYRDEDREKFTKVVELVNTVAIELKRSINQQQDSIEKLVRKISEYITAESKIIEEEINARIIIHLKTSPQFSKYNIYRPSWKRLNVPIKNDKGNDYKNYKEITEFDGLFILSTSDFPDAGQLIQAKRVQTRNQSGRSKNDERIFLVVEGKHALTNDLINDKIKKMKEFQNYIQNASNPEYVAKCTDEYKNKVKTYQLTTFSNKILLYFGGPYVTDTIKTHIENTYQNYLKDNIHVSFMRPQGKRYIMYDIENVKNSKYVSKNVTFGNKVTVIGSS